MIGSAHTYTDGVYYPSFRRPVHTYHVSFRDPPRILICSILLLFVNKRATLLSYFSMRVSQFAWYLPLGPQEVVVSIEK